jgi:hypothetical protein
MDTPLEPFKRTWNHTVWKPISYSTVRRCAICGARLPVIPETDVVCVFCHRANRPVVQRRGDWIDEALMNDPGSHEGLHLRLTRGQIRRQMKPQTSGGAGD